MSFLLLIFSNMLFSIAQNAQEVRSIVGEEVASHIFGSAAVSNDQATESVHFEPAETVNESEPMDFGSQSTTGSVASSRSSGTSNRVTGQVQMFSGANKVGFIKLLYLTCSSS